MTGLNIFHKSIWLQHDQSACEETEMPLILSAGLVSYVAAVVIACLSVYDSLMAYSSMNLT